MKGSHMHHMSKALHHSKQASMHSEKAEAHLQKAKKMGGSKVEHKPGMKMVMGKK